MAVPISYNYRNLLARKLTTLLTVLGVALVVFVWTSVLMMANGLKKTLVSTGSDNNVIVLRKSATSDVLSAVGRESARLIEAFPEIATGEGGKPLISKEAVTIINLYRKESNDMGNVIVRGVSIDAVKMRPQVKIIRGRIWDPAKSEIIVGRSINQRFKGCEIGQTLKFGTRNWLIVGVFDAQKSGFESEIWGDIEQTMSAFNRPYYSTMIVRLKDRKELSSFKTRFESEKQLQQLQIKGEREYYDEQSRPLAGFLTILGKFITAIFSFGAMIGAMITMYASVSNRTVEIGTLRALGFLRRNVLLAFLIESILIALIGGALGVLLASGLQFVSISMLNFASFSEVAFGFDLSPTIVLQSLAFALLMGTLGGFLPAVRASRLNIVNALRAS
ncbi:ABC transporter permease [bacterium]|nr:ABC transporter permease [bacterium]